MKSKQQLGLFSFIMIVVGLVIGMGIFRTAATSAKGAIEPSVYFSAWIIGGFIAICGALTFAEIGSRMPTTGGYYKVFSYAYHPSIAFGVNCIIIISNAAGVAGVAIIGSGYIAKLFPSHLWTDIDKALLSSAGIIAFYCLNLFGLKASSLVQNILMLIKISMVMLLVACLFSTSNYAEQTHIIINKPTNELTHTLNWIQSLGVALIAVSFTCGGYEHTIDFGSEVKNPTKNIPRGIFIGIGVIIALYLLVSLCYYLIIGFENIKTENEIAYVLVNKVFGQAAAKTFSFFLFLGVLAYVNTQLMSNPRLMFAMGDEGTLPKIFSKQNAKTQVLTFALTVFAALCIVILFFAQTFDRILNFSIFLDCFGMVASSAAVFILRKKTKHLNGAGIYQMKYKFLTLLFIIAYSFVGISIAIQTPNVALIGLCVLMAFVIIYYLFAKKNKTNTANH